MSKTPSSRTHSHQLFLQSFPNPSSPSTSRIRHRKNISINDSLSLRRQRTLPSSLENATPDDLHAIETAFRSFPTETINFKDFHTVLLAGTTISERDALQLFYSIDNNSQGTISWSDFASYTTNLFEREVPSSSAYCTPNPTSPHHVFSRDISTLITCPSKNLFISCGADGNLNIFSLSSSKPKATLSSPGPPSELGRGGKSKLEQDLLRVSVDPECIVGKGLRSEFDGKISTSLHEQVAYALGSEYNDTKGQNVTSSAHNVTSTMTSSRSLLRYSKELKVKGALLTSFDKKSSEVKKNHQDRQPPSSDLVNAATAPASTGFAKNALGEVSASNSVKVKSYGAWVVDGVHCESQGKIYLSTLNSSLLVLNDDQFTICNHFRLPRISLTLSSLASHPNFLAFGDTGGYLGLWDCKRNLVTTVNQLHPNAFVTCCTSAWPNSILSGANDGSLVLSDAEYLSKVRIFERRAHSRPIYCIDHHKSQHLACFGGLDRSIFLIDPYVSSPIATLNGHTNPVISLGFCHSSDQPMLISSSIDKTVKIWDLRMNKCVHSIRDSTRHIPSDEFKAAKFLPNFEPSKNSNSLGTMITAGSTIKFWSVYQNANTETSNSNVKQTQSFTSPVVAVLWSELFKIFCVIRSDLNYHIFELDDVTQNLTQNLHLLIKNCIGNVTSACSQSNGRVLVITTDKGFVYFIHPKTGAVLAELPNLYGDLTKIVQINNSNTFGSAVIGTEGLVCLVPLISNINSDDPCAPLLLPEIHSNFDVIAVEIIQSQSRLITGDTAGTVCLWNLKFRSLEFSFSFKCSVSFVSLYEFTADNVDLIVATDRSDEVNTTDVNNIGTELWHLKLSSKEPPLAFSTCLLHRFILQMKVFNSNVYILDNSGYILIFKIVKNADVLSLIQSERMMVNVSHPCGFDIFDDVILVYGDSVQVIAI
ncbi:hypothetical protein P9112_014356 [Eukaryota sp. TZLM1-RC]